MALSGCPICGNKNPVLNPEMNIDNQINEIMAILNETVALLDQHLKIYQDVAFARSYYAYRKFGDDNKAREVICNNIEKNISELRIRLKALTQ